MDKLWCLTPALPITISWKERATFVQAIGGSVRASTCILCIMNEKWHFLKYTTKNKQKKSFIFQDPIILAKLFSLLLAAAQKLSRGYLNGQFARKPLSVPTVHTCLHVDIAQTIVVNLFPLFQTHCCMERLNRKNEASTKKEYCLPCTMHDLELTTQHV